MLIIDFETRSRENLLTKGAYNYAQHESTDILCAAFMLAAPEDTRRWIWTPADGALPADLRKEILAADFIAAHNAQFDRLIWECVAVNDYGFPVIPLDQWYCTSAQCRVNNLPASLDDAARALNSKHRKDHKGSALIRKLSIPQKDGTFNDDPVLLAEMAAYCVQDGVVAKSIVNATRLMSQTEHADWLNNEDINERGVLIDKELAECAQFYANDEYIEIADRLNAATHGAVTKHTQIARAANWIVTYLELREEDTSAAIKMMMRLSDEGVVKYSLDKATRADLLNAESNGDLVLPSEVLDVINAMNEGSASSVTKFKNMLLRADNVTHRVQGAFVYAGASQTLRYCSRGLQMHNMPSRGLFKTMDEAWEAYDNMLCGAEIPKPVMGTLKKMLRHAITAPDDKLLVIGDWSGIEARVLPWLSDSIGGDEKLGRISAGEDVYTTTALAMGFKGNRPVGKVAELSLGYQGGLNAFKVFAKSYGVAIPDSEIKRAIKRWREVNNWAVTFWDALERAAMRAMKHGGIIQSAGRIRYLYSKELMEGSLLCILPDDSVLTYPKARIGMQKGSEQITSLASSVKMKADATEWPRESLYGGRLAGHVTQGTAAALLRDLLSRVDDCIAHVHDEVILEVPEHEADARGVQLGKEMTTPPEWAKGLPLAAKPEITDRYKK